MPSATTRPDYLAIGHVTKECSPEGEGSGGTVVYSAITAQRLGLQAAIVTACATSDDNLLDDARDAGVWVCRVSSSSTTTFRNIYDEEGNRDQTISSMAAPVSYADIPENWPDSQIVHLAPVAQELSVPEPGLFACRLLGITPQGWMRHWDSDGRVLLSAWPVPAALSGLPSNAMLVLSFEDVGRSHDLLEIYSQLAPRVAVTHGASAAYLYEQGARSAVPPGEASPVDPTGAGDVFAAALFVRFCETQDLQQAARFAHAAAGCNIEGYGTSAIPDRRGVEFRMRNA